MDDATFRKHCYKTAKRVGQGWHTFLKLVCYLPDSDSFIVFNEEGRVETINAFQLDFFGL